MEALGVLLPLSLGVALSSVPIMAVVVILLSPRGRASGVGFLIGYFIGLVLVTMVFTIGLAYLPRIQGHPRQPIVGTLEILLGAVMIGYAVYGVRRTRRLAKNPSELPPEVPIWLRRMAKLGPFQAFAVGIILNLRPKALVLAIAAGLAISASGAKLTEALVVTGVYVVIGCSTVAVPVVVVFAAPERAGTILKRMRTWIERNSHLVSSVVILMVGVVLIGDALSRL